MGAKELGHLIQDHEMVLLHVGVQVIVRDYLDKTFPGNWIGADYPICPPHSSSTLTLFSLELCQGKYESIKSSYKDRYVRQETSCAGPSCLETNFVDKAMLLKDEVPHGVTK